MEHGLAWQQRFSAELPADPDTRPQRRQVTDAFAWVAPTPVAAPKLLAHSAPLAARFGLGDLLRSAEGAEVFAGNRLLPGMKPFASSYGGHQFGSWAGQLGDGRAITLGELPDEAGVLHEFQLKGAGPTPFSRTADGRAVLRSSLREFLMSEAMHYLGVPTTRALTLVQSGEAVVRDMFYDGRARPEPGAIVCRVAPTFLRFGHFELLASRDDTVGLKRLADFALRHFFDLDDAAEGKERYLAWIREVAQRTAVMIDHWMRVGFVHGVMNTDNMSVLGLSIDYGPYGWVDNYDPNWTPNTTDLHYGRYRFGQQPRVALWNLLRFADALLPLIGEDTQAAEDALGSYHDTLERRQVASYLAKLGLFELRDDDDLRLIGDLLELLAATETDMTLFFRLLPCEEVADPLAVLNEAYYQVPSEAVRARTMAWLKRYWTRGKQVQPSVAERQALMQRSNPKYVLRNYMAQLAIDEAEAGDCSRLHTLLKLLERPYDEQAPHAAYFARRPEWARHRPGCAMLSCSS